MSIPSVYTLDAAQAIGTWTPARSVISGQDADGIAYWQFWDTYDSGAWIWADGNWQWPGTLVTSGALDNVYFGGAVDFATETIWVRAVDAFGTPSDWNWLQLSQTAGDFTAPSLVTYDISQYQGGWTSGWSAVSAWDDTGVTAFQFYDSSWSGAWLWANGDWQWPQTTVTVNSLDDVWIGGAQDSAWEQVWVRASDSSGNWSDWNAFWVGQAIAAAPPPDDAAWLAGVRTHDDAALV